MGVPDGHLSFTHLKEKNLFQQSSLDTDYKSWPENLTETAVNSFRNGESKKWVWVLQGLGEWGYLYYFPTLKLQVEVIFTIWSNLSNVIETQSYMNLESNNMRENGIVEIICNLQDLSDCQSAFNTIFTFGIICQKFTLLLLLYLP